MNNNIVSFQFHTSTVRTITKDQEPLFCLADLCSVLNLQQVNKTANQIKEEFELAEFNSPSFDTGYGVKDFTMITEPQLYFVIFRSRADIAKEFRQWVFTEVLPSIRKTGKYQTPTPSPVPEHAGNNWWRTRIMEIFNHNPNKEIYNKLEELGQGIYKQGFAVACSYKDKDLKVKDAQINDINKANLALVQENTSLKEIIQDLNKEIKFKCMDLAYAEDDLKAKEPVDLRLLALAEQYANLGSKALKEFREFAKQFS